MKLNWFSPLPPARTDIAHYTKRLLSALSRVAQVTLWTDQHTWDRKLEKVAIVRSYRLERMPWVELNRADMTFYQIGNNPLFHGTIWQVSRLLAGVVVLHDFRLHHFFDGIYRVKLRDQNSYLAVMARYYGEEGRRDAATCYQNQARNIDYMAERYPLTQLALENALGVLVHTHEAFANLTTTQCWPLAYVPLPFPRQSTPASRGIGTRPDSPRRLILFGYIGRNRRLSSVLKAIAEMEERDRFHLDVFGNILDDEKELRAQISSLNLKNRVTLHGFTAEAELEKALSTSDLAINLRYPTMGEASGSQLRIWSHGRPSLVSQVGWYASLPEDSVAFVRPDENEVTDIQKHLRSFLETPERFAAMGERGREELENRHSPEAYAEAVITLAAEAQSFRPQAAQLALAERAARKAGEWAKSERTMESFRRVAAEVYAMAKRS